MAQPNQGIDFIGLISGIGPTILSAAALIISYRGYRISKRTEQRSIERTKPIITVRLNRVAGQPEWVDVYWSFENRDDQGYRCNFIRINRPWVAKGLGFEDAHDPPNKDKPWEGYGAFKNPLPIQAATRSVPVEFTISKAKIDTTHNRPNHWESIYVHVPWWWPFRRISMSVSLSSIDMHERETIFTVKRTMPHVNRVKTD